ncbi:ribosome-inactivating family protein [Streptomyces sp. NPDC051362]|uniref:ribosome-inactivating family protein n=1 Tax=Streptomyces sp. NPDC051362 TaxID=3365651 RepID=UPI0037A99E1F
MIATMAALLAGTGTAKADTGTNQISHVFMNVTAPATTNGPDASANFGQFAASLRAASGHRYFGSAYITQNVNTYPTALIRADLTLPDGHSLWLWLTPNNLYLRGFTTVQERGNVTYYFRDDSFKLSDTMEFMRGVSHQRDLLPPAGSGYRQLPYSGDYPSILANMPTNVNRGNQVYSYGSLWNAIYQLAWANGVDKGSAAEYRKTAANLMFMIQLTSESARLWDVQGKMSEIFARPWAEVNMPIKQQELENNWSKMSTFLYNWLQFGFASPIDVPQVGDLITYNDALKYVAEVLWPNQG